MSTKNKIVNTFIVVVLLLLTWKGSSYYYEKQNNKTLIELKKEKIKNDSLKVLEEGLVTKLVADTLENKRLKKINDSLKLKLKNPKVVTVIKYKLKEVEKPVDTVKVKDSTITIVDNYPNKENPFVTYKANVDKFTGEGIGKFTFTESEFRLGIGQNKDGTYSLNTKVPEYFKITGIDVQALPMEPTEVDNFGWIVGARLGQDFSDFSNYVRLNGGIRFKKLYFMVGAGTNGAVEGGIDVEF